MITPAVVMRPIELPLYRVNHKAPSGLRGGLEAFLCSCLFIVGMLTSAAFGTYPYVLPSNADPSLSLTVHNTAAQFYGLQVGLMWFIPGMLLACGYFVYTYRSFSGKVKFDARGHY